MANKKSNIMKLSNLDEDDVVYLLGYFSIRIIYEKYWATSDNENQKNAVNEFFDKNITTYHGNSMSCTFEYFKIRDRNKIQDWAYKYLNKEQIEDAFKCLRYSRTQRRKYIYGDHYFIKDQLKYLFNAKWCRIKSAWHVHYKQYEQTKEWISKKQKHWKK